MRVARPRDTRHVEVRLTLKPSADPFITVGCLTRREPLYHVALCSSRDFPRFGIRVVQVDDDKCVACIGVLAPQLKRDLMPSAGPRIADDGPTNKRRRSRRHGWH